MKKTTEALAKSVGIGRCDLSSLILTATPDTKG